MDHRIRWVDAYGPHVSVCGMAELAAYRDAGVTHLVSIWPGGASEHDDDVGRVHAAFHEADVVFVPVNDVVDPLLPFAPSMSVVADVLRWTSPLTARARVLVHCAAGVSRSAALAYGILCLHAGEGEEIECFAHVMGMRPSAAPNELIVTYADTILGRGGAMIRATRPDPFAPYAPRVLGFGG